MQTMDEIPSSSQTLSSQTLSTQTSLPPFELRNYPAIDVWGLDPLFMVSLQSFLIFLIHFGLSIVSHIGNY